MAQIDVANPPKPAGMPIDPKYLYYDPAYVAKGFGLNNTGAICWFNSALQSLISCSQFNNIILKKEEQLKDNRIATTYIELIKKSFQAEDLSSLSTYSTTLLIALVNELKKQKKISDLLTIGQKDASEGLLMLLDLIGCKPLEVLFYHRYETDSICLKCDKVSYTNKTEPPNIMNVLSFRKEISDSKDFVKEILFHWVPNDGIKCENCGEQTDNSVVLYKLKMMRELTMIVIRNTAENLINRHGKNEVQLHKFAYPYPEFLIMPTFNNKKLKYRLISIIEHLGNLVLVDGKSSSGGHYTATCFREGKYLNFNDSSVSPDTFKHSSNAYVLIYSLMEEID